MYYAIKHNQMEMIEFLIKQGVNLHLKDNKNATLVQEAMKRKRLIIVQLLVSNGAPAPEEEKKEKVLKAKPKPE